MSGRRDAVGGQAMIRAMDVDRPLPRFMAVGDKAFRFKCRKAFEDRRQTAGLVMVSHDLGTLRDHCKRCALLDGGQLRIYDTVDEAAAAYEERLAS